MNPFRWIFNITLILIAFGIMVAVLNGTNLFDRALNQTGAENDSSPQAQIRQTTRNYDEIVLQSDRSGHFWVEAYVDDELVRFMVDTGATHVFLSETVAERIGYDLGDEDFRGTAKTADGTARFAPVMIDEINIADSIVIRGVSAAVIEGEGDISLLGMSFLSQLSGFEVNGDEMILKP